VVEVQVSLARERTRGQRPVKRLQVAPPSDSLSAFLALIERLALDPGTDVEKLERMIGMYERLQAREAELAYNVAKGRILKKLAGIKIVKNRAALYEIENGKPQKSSYEAFKYEPLECGGILIRGLLKHLPGGHYEDSFMPAPLDTTGGKSEVQAVGSTNSFLRRYVACNIFNIVVVGDDDDGTGGTIDETQTKTIVELINNAGAGPKFLKYMKAQSVVEAGSLAAAVATIAARDYRKAISTLEEQITKAEARHADLS